MALQVVKYDTSWRDVKGWIGKVRNHIVVDDTGLTPLDDVAAVCLALKNAIGGLTNAAFAGGSGFRLNTVPTLTYGDNATYNAEWMKAQMQFSCDNGNISRFKIPAPELDLFESDGVTIKNDGTQAQVVAYVSAMKTAIGSAQPCNSNGFPFTHFEGGILIFGRQPKRFNERVKSATLVAGEGE